MANKCLLLISFFVLPYSCFIPDSLRDDLNVLLINFKIHRATKILKTSGAHHNFGSNPRQLYTIAETAVQQGIFVNHVECSDIGTRPSTVGAVFYPAVREDQPCDLDDTKKLVRGSNVNKPVFFYSLEETSIPRWLHEMYVPFNTSVNVILRDKREAGWLTLQEVYHLDNKGSGLVVNHLGRREIGMSHDKKWHLISAEQKLAHRINLHGRKIITLIVQAVYQRPTLDVSVVVKEANKTFGLACMCLNASVEEQLANDLHNNYAALANGTADLAIYPTTMPPSDRRLDLTSPFSSVRHRIYIRRPVFVYSLSSVVKGFSPPLWATFGIAIITLALATTFTSRVAQGLSLDLESPTTLSEALLQTLGSACSQGWSRWPGSKSGRCVLLSTALTGFLLNTYFVMQLQSGLSAQTAPLPFRGLDELVQTGYQIYTESRGSAQLLLRVTESDATRQALKKLLTDDREKNLNKFCEKRIVYLTVSYSVRLFKKRISCPLVDTTIDLLWASVKFAIKRDFQFKRLINYSFRRAVEGGLVQRNEIRFLGPVLDEDVAEHFQVIQLDKVLPFLLLYGSGLGVSLGIFFFELVCFIGTNGDK